MENDVKVSKLYEKHKRTERVERHNCRNAVSFLEKHNEIASLIAKAEARAISESEFACAYVVILSRCFYGPRWLSGRFRTKIAPNARFVFPYCCEWLHTHDYSAHNVIKEPQVRLRLCELDSMKDDYCLKKRGLESMWVVDIFAHYNVAGVTPRAQASLVSWAYGMRPYQLTFSVPSPTRVLELQAAGYRCATALVCQTQLGTTFVDEYPPHYHHNCLTFFLHDVQHMERFAGDDAYLEQVGFFSSLERWMRASGARNIRAIPAFNPYASDTTWIKDLHHHVADMNALVSHLLLFFKGKWLNAYCRHHALAVKTNKGCCTLSPAHVAAFEFEWAAFGRSLGLSCQRCSSSAGCNQHAFLDGAPYIVRDRLQLLCQPEASSETNWATHLPLVAQSQEVKLLDAGLSELDHNWRNNVEENAMDAKLYAAFPDDIRVCQVMQKVGHAVLTDVEERLLSSYFALMGAAVLKLKDTLI